ncbi:hypothetical protein ABPG77_010245 [Micractinium sp. CCAP 211/92]
MALHSAKTTPPPHLKPPLAVCHRRQRAAAAAGRPHGGRRAGGAGGNSGELSDSQLYTLLALTLGGMALLCIMVPKTAARLAFGSAAEPPEDQHSHTLALLGWGMAAAAAAAFALEECARKHMERTFTADTLKLGLAGFAALDIALQFYYPRTMTALAAVVFMLSRGLALALPAAQLFISADDRNRLWRDFRRLPRTLPRALSLRQPTMSGLLYLLLTAAFPVAGAAYFAAPKTTLFHTFGYAYGKSTYMTWKGVGGALMTVLPAMTYTLKDKAENGLLGRSVARTLNIGLMLASVGHLLVFGPILNQGHGGWLLPILTATWGTALLASMAGLAAPEVTHLLEQAEAEAAATAPSE